METEVRRNKLLQVRTNALTAEYIYSAKLRTLTRLSTALTLLSLLTPLIVFVALFPAKGTPFEAMVEWFSYISSCILLALAIASLVLRVEANRETFLSARSANTFIASESLELLGTPAQDASWFFRYVANQDAIDQKNVGSIDTDLRMEAYRESLKRLLPGDSSIKCPVCNLSPYTYTAGNCQLCGNGV